MFFTRKQWLLSIHYPTTAQEGCSHGNKGSVFAHHSSSLEGHEASGKVLLLSWRWNSELLHCLFSHCFCHFSPPSKCSEISVLSSAGGNICWFCGYSPRWKELTGQWKSNIMDLSQESLKIVIKGNLIF